MYDIFYGMEKTSLVDYDGYIVCTLFTKGCNFKCPFCHNVSLALNKEIKSIPFDEILEYLEKRKNILDGVCITGGEPTLYKELPEIIAKLKELGLKIKLDTNGSNPRMIKFLIDHNLVDYIAMDIKSGLSGYSKASGKLNPPLNYIKETIKILKSSEIEYEFRTTLVKELHNANDILEIGILLLDTDKIYLQRFVDHGTCLKEGLHEVDIETAKFYQTILKEYVKIVKLRGY